MNYDEAMNYITNTAKFGSNYGLQRTEKILELLDNPHKKIKCVHVAGTNGKGSTTAMISSILIQSGLKVGMYTSPFLEAFEERIQINNINIPKDDLSDIVTRTAEAVDKVVAMGYDHPTEFEIITCAMFLYFYEQQVDCAVVEVGLGGRLDSTNVITPILSVITSISYDHMNILGDTLEKIAFEKGGIIKKGIPVILYPQEEESYKVLHDLCRNNDSKLIVVSRDSVKYKGIEAGKQLLTVEIGSKTYEIELSLLGRHQLLNCAVALQAVNELINQGLAISEENIKEGLRGVKWPGRLELMKYKPTVVIDGAHNADGMAKLYESVKKYFEYERLIVIIGILADKEIDSMIATITPEAYKVLVVEPHSARAESADNLKRAIIKYNANCTVVKDYEKAFTLGLSECNQEDLLLVCGSLHMIGDMRKVIKKLKI
jgi:dihydrofolate synthase / folylpolyglutamate synthase